MGIIKREGCGYSLGDTLYRRVGLESIEYAALEFCMIYLWGAWVVFVLILLCFDWVWALPA